MIKKAWNVLCFVVIMIVYMSYVTSGCVVIFLLKLLVPMNRAQNFFARITKVAWLHLTKAMFYKYFPGKVFIRYDPRILERNRNIIISNHLTEYDWFFISSVLHHFRRFEDICIILKMSLKDIPLLGYGMTFFQFIFLNRKLSKDIEIIKAGIARLRSKGKYDLLLFPEGTYIDKESHPKSQKWSSDAKVEVKGKRFNPNEVIIPRTTGFKVLMDNIGDDIEGFLDVTMIGNPHVTYPNDVFSYWSIIAERSCTVNFVFFLDYIPKTERINAENFVLELFERKERMISKFKESKDSESIRNVLEFQQIAHELVGSEIEYKDTIIDLSTPWGPLFYITFLLNLMVIVSSLLKLMLK